MEQACRQRIHIALRFSALETEMTFYSIESMFRVGVRLGFRAGFR
jgi:hypothetical protein